MAKELSSIKDKLELTKATLQSFSITLFNTNVFRIQKLGSVEVKSKIYICKPNGKIDDTQGHITELKNLKSLDLCLEIQRSSLHLYSKTGRSERVWRATFEGSKVAVKKNTDQEYDVCRQEANILTKATHENVIKMIGVSKVQHSYFLVLEYLTEYSFKEIILNEPVPKVTTMEYMTEIMYKIAGGMTFLGSREIIHSDLRADNILFGSNWNPKICGFRFAHMVNDITIDPKRRRTFPPVR
ncbi:tyrosine-protein kinase Src64B-like [Mytilus trossulus]|uniref:tyrosine-protein kinase Src64B-like n=1 Tax=Mytilus trossulus TaxID=6551 RepID=UPI00300671C0